MVARRRVRRPVLGAVVEHVLALEVLVIEREVAAVGVDGRDDEDVEVVDQPPGLAVGLVVAQQPLGGLDRDQRRHPLARVLLGVGHDADVGSVALAADANRAAAGKAPG